MRINRWRAAHGFAVAVCMAWGCSPSPPAEPVKPFRGMTLTVAVLGDPALPAVVQAQRGEWAAEQGAEVNVLADTKATDVGDVLVFRGDRLGDLIDQGRLVVLGDQVVKPIPVGVDGASSTETDSLKYADVLPAFRDLVTRYGTDRVGLPLGGSALVVVMNHSAFDGRANTDAAAQAGVPLKAPATWDEFDALARYFQGRDWGGDGVADFGVALALGADPDGLADDTFLARGAACGQHRDQYSLLFDSDAMVPRIATPPFVETLERMAALSKLGPPGMAGFDAGSARESFRSGRVALLIDRAEMAATWGEANRIDVAPLPGSTRVYDPARRAWEDASPPNRPGFLTRGGGWLVGVSSTTTGPRREAAIDFARYLASPDTSGRLHAGPALPMLAARVSQLNKGLPEPRASAGVDARAWADAVASTLKAPRVVLSPRFPDSPGYLADLAAARIKVMKGAGAAEALKGVESAWKARTAGLGEARQLWHYRRSLNTLLTTSQPPPK